MQERVPRLVGDVEVQCVKQHALHAQQVLVAEAVGSNRGEGLHAGVADLWCGMGWGGRGGEGVTRHTGKGRR